MTVDELIRRLLTLTPDARVVGYDLLRGQLVDVSDLKQVQLPNEPNPTVVLRIVP